MQIIYTRDKAKPLQIHGGIESKMFRSNCYSNNATFCLVRQVDAVKLSVDCKIQAFLWKMNLDLRQLEYL